MRISKKERKKIIDFAKSTKNPIFNLFKEGHYAQAYKIAFMPDHELHEVFLDIFKPYIISETDYYRSDLDELQMQLEWKDYKPPLPSGNESSRKQIEPILRNLKGAKKKYDPSLFIPLETGTALDNLFSAKGGLYRGRITMVIGDPGVGKSSVLMKTLVNLKEKNKGLKVLYILSEMTEIDLIPYDERISGIDELDIFYPGEYLDYDPWYAFEKVLKTGWDVVLIDSFTDLKDKLSDSTTEKGKKLELKLINTLVNHTKGLDINADTGEKYYYNDRGVNTTFLCINHSTKGGEYEGSSKIKYNTSAMMEVRKDKDGKTYIEFSKNRVGHVGVKLYYTFTKSGGLTFDESRYKAEMQMIQRREKSLEFEKEAEEQFDSILKEFDNLTDSEEDDVVLHKALEKQIEE